MEKIQLCKELRQKTGAPLNLCLKAIAENGLNFDACSKWIKDNPGNFIKKNSGYYRGFSRRIDSKLYLGQIFSSDTIAMSRGITQALLDFKSKEDLLTRLKDLSLAAQEEIQLATWIEVPYSFKVYNHLSKDGITSVGGIIAWKNERVLGEEIHWALGISGQKGKAEQLDSFDDRIINENTLNGEDSTKELLSDLGMIFIVD